MMTQEPVYTEVERDAPLSPFVMMTGREMMWVILCGVGVGLTVAGLYLLMNQFIFGAVLCRPQSAVECAKAPNYAMIVAMLIGAVAGLASLARLRIYRPLLVVIAATIALWSLETIIGGFAWYWMLLASMALFGVAYGLFAWLARIRSFIIAVIVVVVAVVLSRIALML